MKHFAVFLMIVLIIALVSCLSPYSGKDGTGLPGDETPVEISTLFKPEGSTGWIKFYTNDSKYRNPSGYTLWTYNSNPSGPFTERTVRLYKTTGDNIAGYGVVICSEQKLIDGKWQQVFLTVMINNNGQYAVGKVIGSSYMHLENWKYCTSLNKASGQENTIKIIKSAEPNKYQLIFNGLDEGLFFVDSIEPFCSGGQDGYIIVISPADLRGSAVEAWFYE